MDKKELNDLYKELKEKHGDNLESYILEESVKRTLLKCKDCKSLRNCKQELEGLIPTIIDHKIVYKRCSNARGNYNTSLLENPKYDKIDVSNIKLIKDHANKYKGMYLHGTMGKGKTHTLFYIANLYSKKRFNVHIEKMADIIKYVKAEFNMKDTPHEYKSYLDKLGEVDYLFIDDLGNERATDFTIMDILMPLIDTRYINEKPTFISSNYPLKPKSNDDKNNLYSIYSNVDNVRSQTIAPLIQRIKHWGEIEIKGKNFREGGNL